MPEKIKVLYIDDEPENLVGFKASLRLDYQIFTAVNIPDAISCLDNNPDIRVIFCDQRMPGKTGVDFFEEIRVTHPLPVRIMLTAYTDVESIIDAINKGNIFRFVKKPWIEADIIWAIEEANKFYMANSMLFVKNEELQKAYNELNKFAYSVSHDIRGPLTGILGAINLAREIDDTSEIKEMLFLMEKSVKKLNTYVLSMHDYYSMQRGELKITEIDFNTIIDELKAIYIVNSKINNVLFKVDIRQDEVFLCDEAPLRLIINNLLSNAFKYQDTNAEIKSVEVKIVVADGKAVIHVSDTGIGILESHLGEIFNLFFRSNSAEVGSGFGLYNVKSALLKLNGQIEVSSVLHQGTTFKVTIPSI
ncbi:hybrid sensor histidine kinase/response regulator [Mucilaginibacter gotjawali]|uniref:histidine kinase n=2 Tax=Mucilaginibacter gotjawali TaxID=1550579 RepID=A0A110B290_9SPHI|nr:hybrid sensor histidine kinase/response regulator [Mucilaginibacter gotjawali]MBB3056118.1 signal transduction histidine kinase [Mucilaginibacter gotjawali]BAU53545.1 Hydrogenase transcriptional regulatory protein hupR1 [Mucilaginibacter gotjawali]